MKRLVLAAVIAVTTLAATDSRLSQRTVQFHLAENGEAPGLIPKHVKGETRIVYLHPKIALDDRDIRAAEVVRGRLGEPAIQVTLTNDGVAKMNELMRANEHKTVAIVFRGEVVSAPIILCTHHDCDLVDNLLDIEGRFTQAEAQLLAETLSTSSPPNSR